MLATLNAHEQCEIAYLEDQRAIGHENIMRPRRTA